jgi:hypothetical protein
LKIHHALDEARAVAANWRHARTLRTARMALAELFLVLEAGPAKATRRIALVDSEATLAGLVAVEIGPSRILLDRAKEAGRELSQESA